MMKFNDCDLDYMLVEVRVQIGDLSAKIMQYERTRDASLDFPIPLADLSSSSALAFQKLLSVSLDRISEYSPKLYYLFCQRADLMRKIGGGVE